MNGAAASAGTRSTPKNGTPASGRRGHAPSGGSLPPLVVPRIGGVVGAAVTKAPWSIIKGIVVAALAVVNAFLLGIRWRVGRLHAR